MRNTGTSLNDKYLGTSLNDKYLLTQLKKFKDKLIE
jgi:hypothetical protein